MIINDKLAKTASTINQMEQPVAKEKWRGIQDASSTSLRDEKLEAAKFEQQERSRALVRSGARTQESMFFIPSDIAKSTKIRHRTDEF